MTPDSFRRLALKLPDAIESAHMGHADFRIGGKIFATLGYPHDGFAALMLTPEDQDAFVKMHPKAFAPVRNKWGEQGATNVELRHAIVGQVSAAIEAAYESRLARSRRKSGAKRQ
jgi:hypothetical protein